MTVTDKPETGRFRHGVCLLSRGLISALVGIAVLMPLLETSFAKSSRHRHRHTTHLAHHVTKEPTRTHAWMVVDADTGVILSAANADARVYPASLTKMMTLYLTFQALNEQKLRLDQRLPVSVRASRQVPTKLWLKPGDSVRARNLILALVTRSANDAAVVLAEGIAGSEAAFARRMTAQARRLGMAHTIYRNASGLPNRAQHTTARDIARLALALYRDFPGEYDYFSTTEFQFRGKTITGHNRLLDWYRGTDGIKTGYTQASGFNLAASVERKQHRLIGIVIGSPSWAARDKQMALLLDRAFAELGSRGVDGGDRLVATASPERRRTIVRVAAYLSPVAKAMAAPIVKPEPRRAPRKRSVVAPSVERCGIQLGAFRTRKDANALRHATARLPIAKGKAVRVLPPLLGRKKHLYRVQLWHFSEKDARAACSKLKRKKLACQVVGGIDH